jgi:hypothetical protein
MSKYKVTGGNIGALGDRAKAKNFTQNSMLVQDLDDLKVEMAKRAKTPGEQKAVEHINDAREAAKTGDDNTVREKLKAAGAWALQVATEIGKDVASKAISSQLGLPR